MIRRIFAIASAAAVLMVSALFVGTAAADSAGPSNGQAGSPLPGFTMKGSPKDGWQLINQKYEKCLDAQVINGGNGTYIQIWDCNGEDQQYWRFIQNGSTTVLQNVLFGRCLDVDITGGGGNGSRVQLWDCNDSPQQDWWADGLSWHSVWAEGRCLDVDTTGLGANGSKVQIWDCNGEGQQQWL